MSYFQLRLPVQYTPCSHVPDTLLWPLSTAVNYMHCDSKILLSNYHEFVLKKVFSLVSFRNSLSLQPVRALKRDMDAGEAFTFCKTYRTEDSIKQTHMQILSVKAQIYDSDSLREYSNDEVCKEQQRRRKIGLANKGKVPWNKGQKHSEETRLRIKQRTVEALKDPKVREKMAGHPRTHSEQSKERIRSSLRRVWDKRLKLKLSREKFFSSWLETIAETARKGGPHQSELEWDSYDKIKQEIALEQLQWANEKAKRKEMAKARAAIAKEEKITRIARKRKEQEEREKARKLRRKIQEKSIKDREVVDTNGLKLKRRLTMILKRKPMNSQVSIQGAIACVPALEKLNIELIKKEKMQTEVSLAEQIREAKSRRAESVSSNTSGLILHSLI